MRGDRRTGDCAVDVESMDGVVDDEDLDGRERGVDVAIVRGMRTECASKARRTNVSPGWRVEGGKVELTGGVVPAGHDVLDHLVAVEGVGAAHDAERGEAPVDTVETEVLRQVVGQVFPLFRGVISAVQTVGLRHGVGRGARPTLSRFWMYWMCKGISSGFAEVDEDAMTANERRRLRVGVGQG